MKLRLKIRVVVFALFFLAQSGWALQPQISSYRLPPKVSVAQLRQVAKRFEVTGSQRQGFEVNVPVNRRAEFLLLAPQARLVLLDISAPVRTRYLQSRAGFRVGVPGYHSFAEVVRILQQTAAALPATSELITYGVSQQKRPLLALRVSNQLHTGKVVPRVMLTAATHGDEIITTEVLLALMKEMISGKSSLSGGLGLLDELELVFIPVVNPDGFAEQNRYDNGEDPNRSYPYPEEPTHRPTASISGLVDFIEKYPIAGSIDFHAWGRMIMYPWAYTTTPLPAAAKGAFEELTGKMAKTNSYEHGQIAEVIYVAQGSSCDYYYWRWKTLALAVEMGLDKAPNPKELAQYINEQRASTQIFLESFRQ